MTKHQNDDGIRDELRAHLDHKNNVAPAVENVLYIDASLYEKLALGETDARLRFGPSERGEGDNVESFLFWEARLLDNRRYRDWLDLLADDVIYWVPASDQEVDPRAESSINFDDRRRIIDRIALIETGTHHAQQPPSRTCRSISNVETWSGAAGSMAVRSNVAIWEHRRGQTNCFIGYQEHVLIAGESHWQIKRKIIHLLNCDAPQGSVSFIL